MLDSQTASVEAGDRNAPSADLFADTPLGAEAPVHILTCGSVDDGKSTLLGRLLWDAGDLPHDTRSAVLLSPKRDGHPDLSLLLDGLMAEREQGITIDVAWRYFDSLEGRRFVIIDSPGHEQYTRNMASGASHADVAIMLVDARSGIKAQTRRHLAILDLLGVRQVILAVNKMDLVDWSHSRFLSIESDFRELLSQFSFARWCAIPMSAKFGENVARKGKQSNWYTGRTLAGELSRVKDLWPKAAAKFIMPVQYVVREGDFRGLAGTVNSGVICVGDDIEDVLTARDARVDRIVTMDGNLEKAEQGQSIVVKLDRDLDISRGSVLAAKESGLVRATKFEGKLVWLADTPSDSTRQLLLRTSTDLAPVHALTITSRLNLETLKEEAVVVCTGNDIVSATVTVSTPVIVAPFLATRDLGGFVLVDALTGNTVAGGTISSIGQARDWTQPSFLLTTDVLARLREGIEPSDPEYRRRAHAVAEILALAGVTAEISD